MGAHVKHNFKKGFLVDEEKLRKIHDIILKRIRDDGIEYHIFREDSFSFKTTNVDDIINEDNPKWAKINEIELNSKSKDFDLNIDFSEESVELSINGENRDDVFLLYSELKDYMSNEVCTLKVTYRYISSYLSKGIFIAFVFSIICIAFIMSGNQMSEEVTNNIIASNDIDKKINFIIQQNVIQSEEYKILYLFPIFLVPVFIYKPILSIISYLFPSNLFLIGKEIENYKRKLKLRSNLFWGIIIASTISILTGLIV